MDARSMRNCELGTELLPATFWPLTVANPTFVAPTAIALGPSMQGESQFFVLLPPGIELRGILCSRTVTGIPETSSNNLPGTLGVQQAHVENVYTYNCNQPPAAVNDPFPGYDTIFNSNGIYDSVFNNVFPVVPAPGSHYLQMVNSPMPECLLNENQNGIEEMASSMIDQSVPSTFFDSQNPQHILNATAAASQQSERIFWVSPNLPHNFVPAPSLPEYDIKFDESTIFAPPLLADDGLTASLSTYGSCVATSSRHT
ncbi:hypothetical protein BDZ91DRAFT_789363 [Kalaharituber pfeilii]|nr:hypothetical protein BDZ91DRAFT_789363 [Kalaharituber pfeilii]